MGSTVQLDDFPYVHFMRRIDEALVELGQPRMFFMAPDRSFEDPPPLGGVGRAGGIKISPHLSNPCNEASRLRRKFLIGSTVRAR